jgi:hypothetical protein
MGKADGLAGDFERRLILTSGMPFHHTILLKEPLSDQPEKILLGALGPPPSIVGAGISLSDLGGRRMVTLFVLGLPLASASSRSSGPRHLDSKIDKTLLAHTLECLRRRS